VSVHGSLNSLNRFAYCAEAIKRHFESKRRSWREKEAEDPAQILRVQQQSINRRRRARKSNVSKYVTACVQKLGMRYYGG